MPDTIGRKDFREIWLDISANLLLLLNNFRLCLYFLNLLLFFKCLIKTILRIIGNITIILLDILRTLWNFFFKKAIAVFIWVFEFLSFGAVLWFFRIWRILSLFTH